LLPFGGFARRWLGLTLALVGSTGLGWAVDPNRTMSQYVRDRWGPESGFPAGPVYAIHQTPDGYLWIGTEKGLVRFDGLHFRLMASGNPDAPALTHVLGLTSDPEGSLWVRLRRPTLLRYQNGSFEEAMRRLGRPRATVSAMARARDGSLLLWVLEGEGRAIVLRGERFQTLAAPVGFSRSPVLALAEGHDGAIWVGTRDAGLYRLHDTRTEAVNKGLPDLKVNSIVAGDDGQLWVGTDGGVVRWDGTRLSQEGVPPELAGVQALAMTVDQDSNLWVGTSARGLLRVNRHGVAAWQEPGTRQVDAITAIFEDREGSLWVGSGHGLQRLRDSAFLTYSLPEGLPADGGNVVYADLQDRLWVAGADGGLWWWKNGRRGRVEEDGLGRDIVYSIAGGDGEVWLGRQHGGLSRVRYESGRIAVKTYRQKDGLAQDSVYAVYQTRDGSVWAGTLAGGVSRWNGGKFTNYTMAGGLASNSISAILEGADGRMWFGTPAGLSELEQGRWHTFRTSDGIPSDDVICLLEDSAGALWVGTSGGLARREGRGFRVPSNLPAYLRERILGLAEDRAGFLWIATSGHVLRVDRGKLAAGTLGENDLREYGVDDGLRGVEGVRRFRSVRRDERGRIWFSLNHGISVIDPERLRSSNAPAIVHVETLEADGRNVPLAAGLQLPGSKQRIVFGFAGLSLSIPERVRFRYRLDNFDRDWSEPTTSREAGYTNLAPGSYRFRVIASNPDGVWNPQEASFAFEVHPRFWQTWWFRSAGVLLIVAMGVGLYRLKLREVTRRMNVRFEERLAERTRIAQDLHDTLLQGCASASMQIHTAVDRLPSDSPARATLTRAMELMSQVTEEGRNAVLGLRSSQCGAADLAEEFLSIREELPPDVEGSAQIDFGVTVEGTESALHPVLRDEVYRIGREALVNAFRHARARRIDLELTYSPRQLRLIVRDDGCGIDPRILQLGKDGHWGLTGMRERADQIGAELHLRSRRMKGTEVELIVPGELAYADHKASASASWAIWRPFRKASRKAEPAEDQ
jgi:ligand-binding sensor domain-containing protein/signal transduction histidine kinase